MFLPYFLGTKGLVLDIGCHDGYFLEACRQEGISAIGFDIDPVHVQCCLDKGLRAVCADLRAMWEQVPGSFSGIFASHIVEHLAPSELKDFIHELSQRIAQGGVVAIATPNPANLAVIGIDFWNDISHVRPYPEEVLRSLLIREGFEIIESGEVPVFFNTLPAMLLHIIRWPLLRFLGIHRHMRRGDTFIVARRSGAALGSP